MEKHRDMEGERGKAMDTNTGGSPGYQSQSQQPGNSPSEEVRGHWTPTGAEPMDQWMDGLFEIRIWDKITVEVMLLSNLIGCYTFEIDTTKALDS